MDGFRWDYIKQVDTPNFDAFAEKGVRAEFINGSFVTKTFPSHFTIATGMWLLLTPLPLKWHDVGNYYGQVSVRSKNISIYIYIQQSNTQNLLSKRRII